MANYTILLVDDDEPTVANYSGALELAGYDVLSCKSEGEAKALIRDTPSSFDLAVIDIKLRDVPNDSSGFEVAKAIKRDIPLIIFSENLDRESILRALDLTEEGAKREARPLPKSYGTDKLVELIRKILPQRVFVAHGHDKSLRDDVFITLTNLGLNPTLLSETPREGKTVAEAIEKHSNVSFAVILVTPDDLGKAKIDRILRPRARQNVVLEWGYFVGRLGRERVIALYKTDLKNELDLPTNYYGLRYIIIDDDGKWRHSLSKEIANAGIPVNANRLPGAG
jgi:predicted nucleotide-binding protein